jgi:hypothetical protein
MAKSFDDAVVDLYRAPPENFVVERKRLAAELKAHGDKAGAARLLERVRPTISAWSVNQLWWHARREVEELFATAERVRGGGLTASSAHREMLAKLRARAAKMLSDAGHSVSEATLRRVTANLAALAATGGFDPDPPGALSADRDPPGFDALGAFTAAAESTPGARGAAGEDGRTRAAEAASSGDTDADGDAVPPKREKGERGPTQRELQQAKRRRAAEETRQKAEAEAERRELEKQRAREEAERRKLEAALRSANEKLAARQRELQRAKQELVGAETRVSEAESAVESLKAQLGSR